jgi:hypothetical protein
MITIVAIVAIAATVLIVETVETVEIVRTAQIAPIAPIVEIGPSGSIDRIVTTAGNRATVIRSQSPSMSPELTLQRWRLCRLRGIWGST